LAAYRTDYVATSDLPQNIRDWHWSPDMIE